MSYIPAIIFIVGAFVTYFIYFFHVVIPVTLFVFFLIGWYRQNFSILVYEDRFIIRQDLIPGALMRGEHTFDFASISYLECNGNNKPYGLKDIISVLTLSVFFPPVQWYRNYFKVPETEIKVEFKNIEGQQKKTEVIKIRFPKKKFTKGLTVLQENYLGGPGPWEE
ncbi:MAG: hypothetical protein IAF38_00505 [Bacteroidia bacterium]|nr:hypothetical protein [Bacteroidia bacterium]